MFPLLSLLLFIFMTYPKKKKIKENDFFFLKNLSISRVRMQKYRKSTSIQKVSSMGTTLFLKYSYFIVENTML